MVPSDHCRKRPFQPSTLDRWLGSGESDPYQPASRGESLRAPTLPDSVQSSLLSVGMRIRKAVPEGYKTHKTMGASNTMIKTMSNYHSSQFATHSTRRAELTPFCGLFKIGGLGTQQEVVSAFGRTQPVDMDWSGRTDQWDFNSSQGSQVSVTEPDSAPSCLSTERPLNKRSLDDEDDGADSDEDDKILASLDGPIDPRFDSFSGRRVFARPRGRRRGASSAAIQRRSYDTEMTDFEEASFLKWDELGIL